MPIDYTFLNKLVEDIKSFGFTITSTTGGKHNTGSKHSKGKAVDVRTSDKTEQQCIAFISG
jgi:D-alanyl-D-alanine dipeptidase